MIKGATDKCYICGKSDHFARDCKRTVKEKTVNGNEKCDCPTSFFSHRRKNARSPIYSLILKRKTITLTPLNGSFRNPTDLLRYPL
jgi:hypothetical protein